MTIEDRYVIGVVDIQTVVFACTHADCGGAVRLSVKGFKDLQTHCPECGAQWLIDRSTEDRAVHALMQSLQALALAPAFRVSVDVCKPK